MNEEEIKFVIDIIMKIKEEIQYNIKDIASNLKEDMKSVEDRLGKEFDKFYTDAHDMMSKWRNDFKDNMGSISANIAKIVNQLNDHDKLFIQQKQVNKDLDNRIKDIENSKKSTKKTIKQIIYDIFRNVVYPVIVILIGIYIGSRLK